MNIELRKVAHYPRLSQETEAFNADVYVDGVKRGSVQNDGNGGPNLIHPYTLNREIEAYASTLPPEETKYGPLPMSADYLISKLLDEHLLKKDLQKLLKKKTVFVINNKCYEMRLPHRPGAHEKAQILNDLPFEEAFKLYKETAVK